MSSHLDKIDMLAARFRDMKPAGEKHAPGFVMWSCAVIAAAESLFKSSKRMVLFLDACNYEDYLVESRNLMNGNHVLIPASSKNTCCDPGTETYWSM